MLVCPPHTMMTLLPRPRKPLSTSFAEAFAVAQQEHDGDESPDDAEHGEAGAQAIAEQRIDALTDDLREVHGYSVLRHSMGLRLAARRAG